MKSNSYLSCLLVVGLLVVLAFVAFIVGNGLLARAETVFGQPSPSLNAFQHIRIGLELGLRVETLTRPADAAASPVRFDIHADEPASQIGSRLWSAGLIREGQLFSNYLFYTGLDTQLQTGSFEISAAMSPVEIAHAFLDPTPATVTLVVLPGWRLEEIAASLPSAGVGFSPEDFLLAAWNPPGTVDLPADFPAGASLEGYLLPGSYELDRDLDATQAINVMLTLGYDQVVDETLRQGFAAQGLSERQALILASIVQRETVIDDEMRRIASVFLNRLAAGMSLESDPTVQYSLGFASGSWWKTPLTSVDLAVDSDYNTYQSAGLPPGPIAAPSLDALNAVAFPETTPYFFFQAACDGSGRHAFAQTYDEHVANNCQ